MAAQQNDALKDLDSAKDELSGQSYSYTKAVPDPANLGVGSDGNFGQVARNIGAAFEYVDMVGFTRSGLGDSYLVNTGGTCISPSGTLEDRYSYVDNRPKQKPVLNQSLMSGVLDDITAMNPVNLYKAIKASGTPACRKYKCDVTNRSQGDTAYISPLLTPDFDSSKCKPIAEPSDPDAAIKSEIESLKKQLEEQKQLAANDPDNTEMKAVAGRTQDKLTELLEKQTGMADRRKQYADFAKDDKKLREGFDGLNSHYTAGVAFALIALAALTFMRR